MKNIRSKINVRYVRSIIEISNNKWNIYIINLKKLDVKNYKLHKSYKLFITTYKLITFFIYKNYIKFYKNCGKKYLS